jgi:predicted RNA-binding Zn-ribbon protein involved in translation (DUF1610 family)
VAVAETTSVLTGYAASSAVVGHVVLDYEPMAWTDSLDWVSRAGKLKEKYERHGAMAKKWAEIPQDLIDSLPPKRLRECKELIRLGMERKAIRLAYCRKLAQVYYCQECGRPAKKVSNCKNRMCPDCAAKNFDVLFKRFLPIDSMIPASVRSLPEYGWYVLDFSFRHDGHLPDQCELRAMVGVIRRTVQRAIYERCQAQMDARKGCRLRLNEDGSPLISADGWPIAGAPDGEARELVGWTVFYRDAHKAPDNAARKRGERGAKKDIPARYELRFGYDLIRVTEFGFDNVNAHFHCAYFGPRLDYAYEMKCRSCGREIERDEETGRFVCSCNGRRKGLCCRGRLVDIFKEESAAKVNKKHPSRGGLGEESYTVFFEAARHGFRSVLAHALKYTKKIPASKPEGLARLEHALQGTRRVALLGMHYGVPLKSDLHPVKCPSCGGKLERVKALGLVLLSEVADLPDAVEESSDNDADFGLDEECRAP